jgi:hypothetical protein
VLEKPASCIFFISCYISHDIRHPIPLLFRAAQQATDMRTFIRSQSLLGHVLELRDAGKFSHAPLRLCDTGQDMN